MWFYSKLSAKLGAPTARVILTAYYAVMIAVILTFVFEPQAAFRYAQL